mmetsp:Transcript_18480/g.39993  ORF Transcript_18480/g.39993 Transcript_18480/m.39993 type:complete len:555 (-) Transcript_18480:388-2052(-)
MSDQEVGERPAKMAKRQTASPTAAGGNSSSAHTQLLSLLTELNGGKPLALSITAAIKALEVSCDATESANHYSEMRQSSLNKLFADHVGKSPEIVIGNAIRHAEEEVLRELHNFNKVQTGTYSCNEKWLNHPENAGIKGPKPDCKVWLEMFLGEEQANAILEPTVPMNSGKTKESTEEVTLRGLKIEASRLSIVTLLANVLSYIRNKACNVVNDLLRFSVLYGLDGAMKDIIQGKYGDVGDAVVNTLLPLDDKPLPLDDEHSFFRDKIFFMPPYALGAILGHSNVVTTALSGLGGDVDSPYGLQFKRDGEIKSFDDHTLVSHVMHWVFSKNMPDMLKCLVNECGFQFRWIDHENHIPMMLTRIFEADEYADNPKWTGDLDAEDLIWEGSRGRRQMRAEASYKMQMQMLDLLIALGFPFTLFFPTEPTVERDERMRKEKKLNTREERRAYGKSLSKEERKANCDAYNACEAYNSIQKTEPEMLTLGDYYRSLKSRWQDGQQSVEVQISRLDEFEALDSRWRKEQRQANGEDGNASESDYESESGSGSSYGSPPGY